MLPDEPDPLQENYLPEIAGAEVGNTRRDLEESSRRTSEACHA